MRALCLFVLCAAPPALADVVKREVPDYDGRGAAPTTAGDIALWMPRVAVAPLYLASEYVVRRPMELLVTSAEKGRWPDRLIDLFTFDPERKTGLVPTLYVEKGFHPTAGFYGFADDLGADGNALRIFGSFGSGHQELSFSDRVALDHAWTVGLRGQWAYRNDNVYDGAGPESREADRARYGLRRLEAAAQVSAQPTRAVTLGFEAGARDLRLDGDGCCGDPTVPGAAGMGERGPFARVSFSLDTRPGPPAPRSGLLLDVDAEASADPASGRGWMRWGGTLGGVWDVGGSRRLLGLSATARFVDPLGGGDVPFYDLVTVGGSGPLRGFSAGRLSGRSGLAAAAVYEWPVSVWIDGVLHGAVGDVFGAHLEGLRPGLVRLSTGIGLRTRGEGHRFEILVALGTRTLDDGAGVDSVRLVVGGTKMF
jgi:hypothetical protein